VLLFPNTEADEDFYFVVFPIHFEGDDCAAFDRCLCKEAINFRSMEKEFACGYGLMVISVSFFIGVDFCLPQVGLTIFDAHKGSRNLDMAGTDGFDFCAFQYNSSLDCFKDIVVSIGFWVGGDVGLHEEVKWKVVFDGQVLNKLKRVWSNSKESAIE
jgi:hypothetical protein